MQGWLRVLVAVGLAARVASAQDRIVLSEILASWQGDDQVQFVELTVLVDGQQATANRSELVFDDVTGSDDTRRFFPLTRNLTRGTAGARVLVGTTALAGVAGMTPDFTLPGGWLAPDGGRVCWQVYDQQSQPRVIDCLAWGAFTGSTYGFGPPTRVTPDNRSLERTDLTGSIRADWQGQPSPTPESNDGRSVTLATLCGDGKVSQGEDCDGDALGGATCASLGFARGTLRCTQCKHDTAKCSFCGNGALNEKEQCDGGDLGGKRCESLGFTGGTLGCSARCAFDTAGCDATFYVPGGGPPRSDCQVEWIVSHAGARPDGTGAAPPRLACRDGDSACDAGGEPGACTFPVQVCFGTTDARLPKCTGRDTATFVLKSPAAADPAAAALVAAVEALGGAAAGGGSVTFASPVPAGRCTELAQLRVPARGKLRLKALASAAGGKPRDADAIRLTCQP